MKPLRGLMPKQFSGEQPQWLIDLSLKYWAMARWVGSFRMVTYGLSMYHQTRLSDLMICLRPARASNVLGAHHVHAGNLTGHAADFVNAIVIPPKKHVAIQTSQRVRNICTGIHSVSHDGLGSLIACYNF